MCNPKQKVGEEEDVSEQNTQKNLFVFFILFKIPLNIHGKVKLFIIY
jgi:hypothetical protein